MMTPPPEPAKTPPVAPSTVQEGAVPSSTADVPPPPSSSTVPSGPGAVNTSAQFALDVVRYLALVPVVLIVALLVWLTGEEP